VLPINKNINKEKILLKGIENANILEFCTFGYPSQKVHGSIIDNVVLLPTADLSSLKTDLIVNGDFEQNACYSDICTYNINGYQLSSLPGWLPEPAIEIGKGTSYNQFAGISTVA
jgi:hypothetical protein